MKFENKELKVGKYSISLVEIRDLLISSLVLGAIFSVTNLSLASFIMAVLVLAPTLILHELAHKIMAQKYDLKATYVLWPTGILVALVVALISGGRFIFAALGAVMIETQYQTRLGYRFVGITKEEMGKISIVGPLTNYGLALLAYFIMGFGINNAFLQMFAYINTIIGIFNSLPFPPLDGSKIVSWNLPIYLTLLISGFMILFLPGLIGAVWTLAILAVVLMVTFFYMQKVLPVSQES